ncbi:hypothetical protein [Streptomyces sp. NPDC002889]|uniref:hypothetical protein n=1 Tax=Streptomyces sp. NPDC002889 TaxID=3364669 RepID=UPI003690A21B
MTSAEYRKEAEQLLARRDGGLDPSQRSIEQAAVWAQLATAAAIEEQGKAVRDGE